MDVSRQQDEEQTEALRGPKARTRRLMLDTATRLMQAGAAPSVSEVAEAAAVSRATAYRYFPSQAALVHAVVDEALGPILSWRSQSTDAGQRTRELFEASIPRIDEHEATFRAALKHALEQWSARKAGLELQEPPFTRGHRIDLLRDAISPLNGAVSPLAADRLAKALSLLFGIESLVILKDIWGTDAAEAGAVIMWAAEVLVGAVTQSPGNVS